MRCSTQSTTPPTTFATLSPRCRRLIADIQAGIEHANTLLQNAQNAKAPHFRALAAARDAAAKALDAAHAGSSADPLGAFTRLTKADAELDRLLATVAEEQATAERLNRTLEQALFTAQSRVRAVSDYIDTRRGSVGPEARTRLAEASRQLQAAVDKRSTDVSEAIARANSAAALAAQAQSLANDDVQSAQRAYAARYGGGGNMGAMMGGIIIGDMLGGAMGGGFGGGWGGGWGPTSFGGSSGGSDGGFMGGGGPVLNQRRARQPTTPKCAAAPSLKVLGGHTTTCLIILLMCAIVAKMTKINQQPLSRTAK